MSKDERTTDSVVRPIDPAVQDGTVQHGAVQHGVVHNTAIRSIHRTTPVAQTRMGSGNKNLSCASLPIIKVTGPITTATTPPITTNVTTLIQPSQLPRKRPPLPNFLPIRTQQAKVISAYNHQASPPVTLQAILATVSQSEQFEGQDRGCHGNAGLPYFPMGSLSPPPLQITSNIGTQIPSLRSPIDLLNYAAELKRAHDEGADNIEALEEALGFLKHFSENVCASTKSPSPPDPTSSSLTPDTGGLQVPTSGCPGRCQNGRDARPKSFLREEVDEFNQIFSELLAFPPYRKFSDYLGCAGETDSDQSETVSTVHKTELFSDGENMDCVRYKNTTGARSCDQRLCDKCKGGATGAAGGAISPNKQLPRTQSCPCGQSLSDCSSSPEDKVPPDTGQGSNPGPESGMRHSMLWDENDKLFTQLLDDLDNITGDTGSVRRRKKAREMFSNWLFSEDPKSPENPARKYKDAMRSLVKTRSVEIPEARHDMFTKWRPRSFEYVSEDDADSGYHTGSSTLQSRGQRPSRRPPGEWTLTREDLRCNIECFNNNNHGLIMSLQPDTNTFQGFIRVHMNLIRPINMSLSTRPPSIYDVIGHSDDEEETDNDENQITSFYLPKDTTKVIHINSDTTTQEVIQALLSKFKITDNPRKFALYEKLEEDNKATMRRLEEDEMPLPLCLLWTKDGITGLDKRKFVLQENDTGEIAWEAFSLPELENFLKILNREEEEYVEQVRGKYRMIKIHMERRLKELCPTETSLDGDKRTPVFV